MMNYLKKQSLADSLADLIRNKIVSGEYREGEKLPTETELMNLFQVSRSTVREAMRMLANSGWVTVQQGSGTYVNESYLRTEPLEQRLQRGEEDDLIEVRNLLEEKIIAKAAIHRTDDDLLRMQQLLEQRKHYAAQKKLSECIHVDLEFHKTLARASGNAVLADLYEAFVIRLKEAFSNRFTSVGCFESTQSLHEELLNLIRKGDAVAAVNTIRTIISL